MIKLYVCEISNLIKEVQADDKVLEMYFERLGKARIEHIFKNNKAEDRARALGASLLLLFALQNEGICMGNLPDFSYKERGKPYFAGLQNIHFNVSHTGNMVACAISDMEVGVDIEHVRRIKDTTIQRTFTEREQLFAKDSENGFVRLWTMKEACAKLRGIGFADILEGMEVYKEEDIIYIRKLNQDIRKTPCYIITAEGKLTDSCNYPYYYSVCAMETSETEVIHTVWNKQITIL